MRRLGWYAVSAVVAAMILGSVLLLAANLYVQSQTVQQRIRQALTATLHMPVTIRKTTITPWEGLRIDGLTARTAGAPSPSTSDGGAVNADFLTADSFRVRFALWPLLHRQFVVKLLWLDKPQLAWAQDADGRWQFPPGSESRRHKQPVPEIPPATPAPGTENTVPAPSTPSVSEATLTPATPPPPPVRWPHRPEGFTIALDRFRLRHGNLDFLTAKRHTIGEFEEVNLDGRLSDPQHATGTVWCDKARLSRVGLMLTKFHSNFDYNRDEGLTLSDSQAAFAGGVVAASYHMDTRAADSPFSGECQMQRVDLKQLQQELGSHLELLEGRLQGNLVVNGLSGRAGSRTATGRFELVDARLKEFPLFQTLGELLRIEDLSHMQFKVAQLDYRLDGSVFEVEPLLLVSNDLKITAQGQYLTDDDNLDLHARLVIDEAVSRQLPDFIGGQFKPSTDDAPGSRFIDFTVTGPLNNPKSNLYDRLLGNSMKSLLQGLLSPKSKPPKDKSSKHSPAPATPDPGGSTDHGQ